MLPANCGKRNQRKASIEQLENGYVVEISGELFAVSRTKFICPTFDSAMDLISKYMGAPEEAQGLPII